MWSPFRSKEKKLRPQDVIMFNTRLRERSTSPGPYIPDPNFKKPSLNKRPMSYYGRRRKTRRRIHRHRKN